MGKKAAIAKIARRVREVFEKGNSKLRIYPQHLNGACLSASVMLFDELTEAGFSPAVVSSQTHMFVVCDEFMVDITATQFGHSGVLVRHYPKLKEKIKSNVILAEWWDEVTRHYSIEEASLTNLRIECVRIKEAARSYKDFMV